MKRIQILLAALLIVSFSCSTVNKEEDIATVTAKSGLNMRVKPYTDAKIIFTLPYGAKAEILDHLGDYERIGKVAARWKRITYKNKKGWVLSHYFLNEKIRNEIVHISSKEPKRLINIDTSKSIAIRKIAFYNANKTNIPAYREPSYKAQIVDYLKPQAWITTKKKYEDNGKMGQLEYWYYDKEIGWIPGVLLKKLSVKKAAHKIKLLFPESADGYEYKFYNISRKQKIQIIRSAKAKKKSTLAMSLKYTVPYITISGRSYPSITLFKGEQDFQFSIGAKIRKIISQGKTLELQCYGEDLYPKFFDGMTHVSKRLSSTMPNKNSKAKLFTLKLQIINEHTIKFRGKTYRSFHNFTR